MTINQKQIKPVIKPSLLTWLIVFIVLPVGFFIWIKAAGAILIIADPLKPADAVVALSGDDGTRILTATDLYTRDYADMLFLTQVDPDYVKWMTDWAEENGIPYKKIFVTEKVVTNTVEEARAVRQLARSMEVDSLIVITDPFHTLRTRIIFRKELKGTGIAVQVRPVGGHWYKSDSWWQTPLGIQYTWEEYSKIFFYMLDIY